MRPLWKGSLSFGLVNIPVQMYSAVRSSEHVSFRMLHKTDLAPIRYERICERERKPVPWKDIVKGYEYAKGKYVVLTPEDFKSAALESSKTLEILDFVDATEVDPRYFETPYYLVPSKGGEKAYALLREAIRETGRIGIGRVIMRSNSYHLVGIRAVGDAIVAEVMRFQNELVAADDFTFPSASSIRPQELKMAEQLIANLAEEFDPSKYTDEYRENLMKLIRAKMKGETVEVEEERDVEPTPVVDLMARLQESIAQGKRRPAQEHEEHHHAAKRTTRHASTRTKRARRKTA